MDDHHHSAAASTPSSSAKPEPVSPWARDPLQALQNSLLRFFSQASNETLGACAVGLAASTYLVLGRIGLVLIGAVGGIVLHARWDSLGRPGTAGSEAIAQEAQRKRNELGIEVAKRALDWRDSSGRAHARPNEERREEQNGSDLARSSARPSTDTKPVEFSTFPPESQVAISQFTDAIVGEYVNRWYHPLLPTDQSFPSACRHTLANFIATLANHLSRKRTADPVLDFMANSTSIIIVFLNELSNAIKASPRQEPVDAIRTYLQNQPASSLANMLNRDQESKKLKIIADDLLHNFLEPLSYDCLPVKTFLQEVLAGLILKPAIDGQAKADSINGWIVYLLEDGKSELMHAIDAGVDGATAKLKDSTEKQSSHQRRLSRAEEAMQEAMKEAERMNAMIAEEEANRQKKESSASLNGYDQTPSSVTTTSPGPDPTITPTWSGSEQNKIPRRIRSVSYILDAEGNAITSPKASPTQTSSIDLQTTPIETPAASSSGQSLQQSSRPSTDAQPIPQEAVAPLVIPLTLHKASITIMDLEEGDDSTILRKEPTQTEFLVQIEPASSRFPGWMVMKRYADFVKLQDRLATYARVGVPRFIEQHPEAPSWRGIARRTLCSDLELYLRDALKFEALAESEAMKKFLDKEAGIAKAAPHAKNVLVQGGAALENVGKGFVNVLGQGGKGIAGGGKVVIGGVQGAFGAITAGVGATTKRPALQQKSSSAQETTKGNPTTTAPSRACQEQNSPAEAIASSSSSTTSLPVAPSSERLSSSSDNSQLTSQDELAAPLSEEKLSHLPPPPTEMSDEYSPEETASVNASTTITTTTSSTTSRPDSPSTALTPTSSMLHSAENLPAATTTTTTTTDNNEKALDTAAQAATKSHPPHPPQRQNEPLTTEETRVLVELMLAIITELYSLSPSAWTIRLSLLSAAKTFLLRPQNPQLESIRVLLQESILDAHFSDKGLSRHIHKLRQISAPTPEERANWPAPLTPDESQKLKVKARKLLVERGMPQALTSVMGQQASGEALGKVFDCLQIEDIGRGFVFALLLQALRAAGQ